MSAGRHHRKPFPGGAWVALLACLWAGSAALAAPSKKPSIQPPPPLLEWLPLHPPLLSEFGVEVENSTVPVSAPQLNELVKAEQPGQYSAVAWRIVTLRLPAGRFAGQEVEWKMIPLRGARIGMRGVRGELPADQRRPFEGVAPFPFQPRNQRSRVDAEGRTAVRLNVPSAGLNRVQITATPVTEPAGARSLDFEVPGVIVIDPGHGGEVNLVSSGANHGVSLRGALEKDMALHIAMLTRAALWEQARASGVNLRVHLTRDTDENLTGIDRAALARRLGADQFLILHFNTGAGGNSVLTRGTTEVRRMQGNANTLEDQVFANRLIDYAVMAMKPFDAQARKRDFVKLNTAVANDLNLGNTGRNLGVRTAYLELEFIDNSRADLIWNDPFFAPLVRPAVAKNLAIGLLADLLDPPISPHAKEEAPPAAPPPTVDPNGGEAASDGCGEGDGWLLQRDPDYRYQASVEASRAASAAFSLRGWGSTGRVVDRQGETIFAGQPEGGLYGLQVPPGPHGALILLGDGAAAYYDAETAQPRFLPAKPPGANKVPLTGWHWLDSTTLVATSGEWRANVTSRNLDQPLIEAMSLHLYDIKKQWFLPVALPFWLAGSLFHINHISHDGRIQLFLDHGEEEAKPRDLGWFTIERPE